MARRCELTGKGPMTGNNVIHANNKIPSQRRTLLMWALGRTVRLKVSSSALRTVDHRGGLDAFLLKAKDAELSANALKVKKEIMKAQAAA